MTAAVVATAHDTSQYWDVWTGGGGYEVLLVTAFSCWSCSTDNIHDMRIFPQRERSVELGK